MLKQRIITSLILTPFVIWAVFDMPNVYWSLFILFLVGLSSWEWAHLAGIGHSTLKGIYTATAIIAVVLLVWFVELSRQEFYILMYISIAWWLYRIVKVLFYRKPTEPNSVARLNVATALSIIVALILPFYSLIYLRNDYNFPGYLFYLLMTIWTADVFAYFSGKYLGRDKLAPHVSPGKTWQGVYGALIGTLLGSIIGSFSFGFTLNQSFIFAAITFVIVVVSIFGDLSESLYKRQNSIKDSGNLLPGHGGILDRVDSLSAAAPFYIVALSMLGFL